MFTKLRNVYRGRLWRQTVFLMAKRNFIILKPIWTYGIPLWGTASQSNNEILQRLQNKILRMVTNAPWYVPNHVIHTDLQIPTVRDEITRLSTNSTAKIEVHPNSLTNNLFEKNGPGRLRRYSPLDLLTRFN
jgi:murein L,D-transpeptidase YcbB/YkuD